MPPKRGTKRKATMQPLSQEINGDTTLAPPDRATWPGWVEMESEPAFFSVMLKEMGVQGVKIQEVYSLDDDMLAILPQPVHALIFLFRYKDDDQAQQDKDAECPEHIWFANQVPDFACASVALLNIVNNIPGLLMGKELRDFKDFTNDMDPLSRGDAIDSFHFVKQIHNTFARENDLLIADMHIKGKVDKARKRDALAKARDTRKAKAVAKTPLKEKNPNAGATCASRKSGRASQRETKLTPNGTARQTGGLQNACETALKENRLSSSTKSDNTLGDAEDTAMVEIAQSRDSSPLSDAPSDLDFEAPSKAEASAKSKRLNESVRRSGRPPKPRQDTFLAEMEATIEEQGEEGFHFIAFMPIQGHVWKLDGLDSLPQDMGEFDAASGADWMGVAEPVLQTRMAMYEGADIEFNLMAVVHDPIVKDRTELLQNLKEIQAIEKKLSAIAEDWSTLKGAETKKDVIASFSAELHISQADIDAIGISDGTAESVKDDDFERLIESRKMLICRQGPLRGAVRDALESAKLDDEKARHRRHDYGTFVRSWLGALAENEMLADLVDEK